MEAKLKAVKKAEATIVEEAKLRAAEEERLAAALTAQEIAKTEGARTKIKKEIEEVAKAQAEM